MITRLRLVNFKKVIDDTMIFGAGLTALRGANESSKTTRFQAIVYAFFGARALPLPLAETVTYDKPESSLKVEMDFVFEGSTYTITRSKSGAVITNGTVTANGQAEVTKFVERLFGVNADSATKLMIASQNGLRGALESGEAVPLIEKLANIDLIDTLITKIQSQLPCGNTANVVASIEELDKISLPILNTDALDSAVAYQSAVVIRMRNEIDVLVASDVVDEGNCLTTVAKVVAQRQHRDQLQDRLNKSRKTLEKEIIKPTTDVKALIELNNKASNNRTKKEAYVVFSNLKQSEDSLAGDYNQLSGANFNALAEATKDLGALREEIATAKAMRITETACGLCGKDLQDIPEVVTKNALLGTEILNLEALAAVANAKVVAETAMQHKLSEYSRISRNIYSTHSKIRNFVTLADDVFPPKLIWIGNPEELGSLDTKYYTTEILAAELAELEYNKAVAVKESLQLQVQEMSKELSTLYVEDQLQRIAEAALEEKRELTQRIRARESDIYMAKLELQNVVSVLDRAKTKHATEFDHYTKAQASKKILQASLECMQSNNALIKKLREVRPIVALRLWTVVLAAVSTYFSQIRGEATTITRTANSFNANGRAVGGLSGSTLDALGLAIRMALGKTFLPSVGFLLLDEPSAGMDDTREAAMLGLLSTVAYDQVVVVTHSNLADSFATTVVQL